MSSLAAAAVRNPMFVQTIMSNDFQNVNSEEPDYEQNVFNQNFSFGAATPQNPQKDPTVIPCTAEVLLKMKSWNRWLRGIMVSITTLCIMCSFYSVGLNSDPTRAFFALYALFFATIICCYQFAVRQIAVMLVVNFGFLYTRFGNVLFMILFAFLLFQMSTWGKIMFALVLGHMCLVTYVYFAYPLYGDYVRIMHFYSKVKALHN
jgi:hypothetical protein